MLALAAGDEEVRAELDNVDGVGGALIEQLAGLFRRGRTTSRCVDELAAELEIEAPVRRAAAALAVSPARPSSSPARSSG